MQYIFDHPMPIPWLLADLLALFVTLVVLVFAIRRSRHPAIAVLEGFAFTFFYASVYENFAVVNRWYVYGRSLLMIGDVPLSVSLLEMDVLVTALWLLERMRIPEWCKPVIVGLMGILEDFSLDPYAVRQVFTMQGPTSGRWSWLLEPGMVNIYGVPVYSFSGWMIILLYAAAFLLAGRWWYRRSGLKPLVGAVYPFVAILLAMLALVNPLSRLLLWLEPLFAKGSNAEWAMLAFHLVFSAALLAVFWRGRMNGGIGPGRDYPLFAVPVVFHLSDIAFTLAGGYTDVLWLILLTSCVHFALLAVIYLAGRRAPPAGEQEYLFGP